MKTRNGLKRKRSWGFNGEGKQGTLGQRGWLADFSHHGGVRRGFPDDVNSREGGDDLRHARTKPEDPYYKAAEETARLLAKAKFAVITGGGPGIMEAANKGAHDGKGTSVGLNISLPHEQESNPYINVGMDFHYFYAQGDVREIRVGVYLFSRRIWNAG